MAEVLITHTYHLPYDTKQLEKMQPYPPLAMLYAATALEDHGISVAAFDPMLHAPFPGMEEALASCQPKIVVVYEDDFNFLSKMCLTRMREIAWKVARDAHAAGATAIVHGSDSTDHPELFLDHGFDSVLCGEAEAALVELCRALLDGNQPPPIAGLVERDRQGGVVRSPERLAKNPEWQHLHSPRRDFIDLQPYRDAWLRAHAYFSLNMVSSRGCPYHCNWCAKPISGNKFQLRAAASVAEEMKVLKFQAGAGHIWFSDDVFALNHLWVREFAQEVTRRNAALPFKIQSRADLMTAETVDHLKTAGCAEVWMGVESGSQAVLNAMDKGLSLAAVVAARDRLAQAGIHACYFLQFGYPGESWDELQETIAFVRTTRPDDIGVSFSYPLPGTVFYERVRAQLGDKRNWTDSDDLCILFGAAYTTDFYRAVRDALHAEVDSWRHPRAGQPSPDWLWRHVNKLEPVSRNAGALGPASRIAHASPTMIPLEQLTTRRA
ncbi:MAG TPA: radical SAM protein [Acidobacteriaceae bacterium]|nr:radical SAM protein [Acidobacteriaceae bacterium]